VPLIRDFNKSHFSPTFYEHLLSQYSFAKKLQRQTVIREKLRKELFYLKVVHRMLVKLTPLRPTLSLSCYT